MRSWSRQPFGTTGLRAAPEEQAVPSPLVGTGKGRREPAGLPKLKTAARIYGGWGGESHGEKRKKMKVIPTTELLCSTELLKKIVGGEVAEAQERWRYDVGHGDL